MTEKEFLNLGKVTGLQTPKRLLEDKIDDKSRKFSTEHGSQVAVM